MFVLLFAALKVAGQTTGYLRYDTVRIMKQNGTCELYIINKTKDSLGLLTNVGGGLTRFIKPKTLNDSTIIIGLDTLHIKGSGTPSRFGLPGEDELGIADRYMNMQGHGLTVDSGSVIDMYSNYGASLIISNTAHLRNYDGINQTDLNVFPGFVGISTNASNIPGKLYIAATDSLRISAPSSIAVFQNDTLKAISISDLSSAVGGNSCLIPVSANGTDISSTIQSLINSGCKNILIERGSYTIGTTVQMKDSVVIRGEGKATVLNVSGNFPAFKCSYALGGNKSQFMDLSFTGNRGTGTISQGGIFSDSANGIYIHNIAGYKLSGFAVRFRKNGFCCGSYPLPTGVLGNIVSDIWVDSCYGGVKMDTIGEYNSVINSTVVKSVYGIYVSGGNARVNGNNLSGNTYGLYLTGGSNNGHGVAANNVINHNDYNIYLTGVSLGYVFTGNQAYASTTENVHVESCDIVKFYGGSIAGSTIVVNGSTNTTFSNTRIASVTWSVTGQAPTIIEDGKVINGMSITDVVNNNEVDITYTNNVVNINTTSLGKIKLNDSVVVSKYLAGSETNGDSLRIRATTGTNGKIFFGNLGGTQYREVTDTWGVGVPSGSNPADDIHVQRNSSGVTGIRVEQLGTGSGAGARFIAFNNLGNAAQFLLSSSNNVFNPDGLTISSGGANGMGWGNTGGGNFYWGNNAVFTSPWTYVKMTLTNAGNLLIKGNPSIDNSKTLQINGAVTINKDSVPIISSLTSQYVQVIDTLDNQIKRTSIASLLGYKVYNALLTQSGTSDPTATVLGANQVGSIVWTRTALGSYTGVLSGAFTSSKTFILVGQNADGITANCFRSDNNTVTLKTYTTFNGGSTDVFSDLSIEIRVYP
jgi:hypothetical protein